MSVEPDVALSPKLDAFAEAVAARVLDALAERQPTPEAPLTANEVATRLGISRGTVYAIANELGAFRIGDGPKARLRFPPDAVDAYQAGPGASSGDSPEQPKSNGRPRAQPNGRVELLPIRGQETQ